MLLSYYCCDSVKATALLGNLERWDGSVQDRNPHSRLGVFKQHLFSVFRVIREETQNYNDDTEYYP